MLIDREPLGKEFSLRSNKSQRGGDMDARKYLYVQKISHFFDFLFSVAIMLFYFLPVFAKGGGYYQVAFAKIDFPDTFSIQLLYDKGIDPEAMIWKSQNVLYTPIPNSALQSLQEAGCTIEVLIPDMTHFYQQRNKDIIAIKSKTDPEHFQYGSMGGFYTLDEVYEQFNEMKKLYPSVVYGPDTIGWSVENRPILLYTIRTEEAIEKSAPKVLYTAAHHAREPGSITTLIYFLWWILEKYADGIPEYTYLLRNRQIFIVPVVNPDGYYFNQTIAPEGGGMWRKNRRPLPNGAFGVDLNRNYGPMEFWNSPNNGSSDNPNSDLYRGEYPFSEPETQAMRKLCSENKFEIAVNYHTYGDLYIYPYSARNHAAEDSLWYWTFCRKITEFNDYTFGRDIQTVGYAARGVSDDWMYLSDSGKYSIFSFTPEAGSIIDGFWPTRDRIIPIARENLYTNISALWSAGVNIVPIELYPINHQNTYCLVLQNIGRRDLLPDTVKATIKVLSQGAKIAGNTEFLLTQLRSQQAFRDTFTIETDPSVIKTGERILIEIALKEASIERKDTFAVRNFSHSSVLWLYRNAQDSIRWTGQWGGAKDLERGDVLTDSPQQPYGANEEAILLYDGTIPLDGARHAILHFWTRWEIEPRFDFATVEISTDSGLHWEILSSSRMRKAEGIPWGVQTDSTIFGFDGYFPFWIYQECDLQAYLGKEVKIRFVLRSDEGLELDGWYLDDIGITLFPEEISTVSQPSAEITLRRRGNTLVIEGIQLHHHYRIDVFNLLGQKLFSQHIPPKRFQVISLENLYQSQTAMPLIIRIYDQTSFKVVYKVVYGWGVQ